MPSITVRICTTPGVCNNVVAIIRNSAKKRNIKRNVDEKDESRGSALILIRSAN